MRPRRWWLQWCRRALIALVYLAGVVFASAAIAAVVIGGRLAEGPIRVNFLLPYIQDSLAGLPDGWRVETGDSLIAWDGDTGTVRIRLQDVGFRDAADRALLTVPQATFTVYGDTALRGRIEPKDITLAGVSLVMTRGADGGWSLGAATSDKDNQSAQMERGLSELSADLFGTEERPGVLGRLRLLSLVGSQVSVIDRIDNRVYALSAHRIWLRGQGDDVVISADVGMRTGGLDVPLRADLLYSPEAREISGDVAFGAVSIVKAARALDGPTVLEGLDFGVEGEVSFRSSTEGGLSPLKLKLRGGEGAFDLPGHLEGALPIRSLAFEGAIDLDKGVIEVVQLDYDAGDFVARADGIVTLTESGPDIRLSIVSDRVPVVRVPAYWPVAHGQNVRSWLVDNLTGGVARNVVARMDMAPDVWRKPMPDRSSFDVTFDFDAADVRLPAPFDPISDGAGRLHVTGRTLEISVSRARMGSVDLADGRVAVEEFAAETPILRANLASLGTIAETAEAVLRGRIAANNPNMEQIFAVGGEAAVRAEITVPLLANARLDSAGFAAEAVLTGVVADGLFADLPIASDRLELRIDPEGAELQGPISVGKSAVTIQWIEPFTGTERTARQVAFQGQITSVEAQRLGLPVTPYLLGVVGIEGVAAIDNEGKVAADIRSDLSAATIDLGQIGWRKRAGDAGRASFRLTRSADSAVEISGLDAVAPGLVLQGDVSIAEDGALRSLRFERVDLFGSSVSAVARPGNGDGWQVQIAGDTIDLRPWIDFFDAADDTDAGTFDEIAVDFALERLILTDELVLTEAVGSLLPADPLPVGDIRGLLNGRAGVQFEASQDRAGWRGTLTSADAGEVLAALGLTGALQKGALKVHAVSTPDGTVSGLATISDFSLSETPAFARLLSLASFSGIGEALSGRGLSFSRAEAPFSYEDGRLDIRKGRMAGPSVGLTAEGYYDTTEEKVRFVGNLIPAYSISQVLGQIPLLGAILGGDQGLFGVTYEIDGPANAPTVTVNPLSALAPGILRRMFLAPVDPEEAAQRTEPHVIEDIQ